MLRYEQHAQHEAEFQTICNISTFFLYCLKTNSAKGLRPHSVVSLQFTLIHCRKVTILCLTKTTPQDVYHISVIKTFSKPQRCLITARKKTQQTSHDHPKKVPNKWKFEHDICTYTKYIGWLVGLGWFLVHWGWQNSWPHPGLSSSLVASDKTSLQKTCFQSQPPELEGRDSRTLYTYA